MPLNFIETTPLAIPASAFGGDGIRTITIQGALYGGHWSIGLPVPFAGAIQTEPDARLKNDPRFPDLAVESLFIWLRAATRAAGIRLVGWEPLNHLFSAGERPYFCAARAVFADATFAPRDGVTYADEWSLDRAMMTPGPSS